MDRRIDEENRIQIDFYIDKPVFKINENIKIINKLLIKHFKKIKNKYQA